MRSLPIDFMARSRTLASGSSSKGQGDCSSRPSRALTSPNTSAAAPRTSGVVSGPSNSNIFCNVASAIESAIQEQKSAISSHSSWGWQHKLLAQLPGVSRALLNDRPGQRAGPRGSAAKNRHLQSILQSNYDYVQLLGDILIRCKSAVDGKLTVFRVAHRSYG